MANEHKKLIDAIVDIWPQLATGPAGRVFSDGDTIEVNQVIEAMTVCDMVMLHRKGLNPWKDKDTARLMTEVNWYGAIPDSDIDIALKALSLLAAVTNPVTVLAATVKAIVPEVKDEVKTEESK